MENNVSFQANGDEPLYRQMARFLRTQLDDGSLTTDKGTLPSFRALASRYGVSISVMQRAMGILRAESVVRIHHGKSGRAVPGASALPEMSKFAMLHPYAAQSGFERALFSMTAEAFERNECNAMLVVHSSEGSPEREREMAETLVYNGVKGLLLSPEDHFANREYFETLSQTVPVVLLDHPQPATTLPAVIFDYAAGGREIGRELQRRRCRNLLVLLNEHSNRSIQDLLDSLREFIPATRLELPLFLAEHEVEQGSYALFDQNRSRLIQALSEIRPDAIFCPFNSHLDHLFMEGVPESLRNGIFPLVLRGPLPEWRSRPYNQSGVLEWEASHIELLSLGVKRLLTWCRSSRVPHGIKKIQLTAKWKNTGAAL